MNAAVGTLAGSDILPLNGKVVWAPWLDGTGKHTPDHPWRTYGQFSQMTVPGSANLWVFVDEDQGSIDLGSFHVSMIKHPTSMIDWPATYHNYGASFAFADGHSENHKWKDGRTRNPASGSGSLSPI